MNIYYGPETVLSVSHTLTPLICTSSCYYTDVNTLASIWISHTPKMLLRCWDCWYYIYTKRVWKNFIICVTEVSGGEEGRSLKQIQNVLRKHIKETASGVLLWWSGGAEHESFLRRVGAFVFWTFHQCQRMQDLARLSYQPVYLWTSRRGVVVGGQCIYFF